MFRESRARTFSFKDEENSACQKTARAIAFVRCLFRVSKNKTAGLIARRLRISLYALLAARAAGAGIPLRMRIERRLHDQAADDRDQAVRGHHEHFARTQ